jgi:hypothetical protein
MFNRNWITFKYYTISTKIASANQFKDIKCDNKRYMECVLVHYCTINARTAQAGKQELQFNLWKC